MKRILIVDDEENIGRSLCLILEREGYAVSVCGSVSEFHAHPDSRRAHAYLFDVRLPDGSGIDLLRAVRQGEGSAPAIMISGHGTIADAVEATRAGAFDFLEKPLGRDKVLLALKNALEQAVQLVGEEVHRQYILSFGPKGGQPGVFHTIRVVVKNRPELQAKTLECLGWWGPKHAIRLIKKAGHSSS